MSAQRVLVIACGALSHDLVRVKARNGWDFMDFQCLPAELHNKPELIPDLVRQKIQENRAHYENIFIGYSDCGTGGLLDQVIDKEKVERLPGAHCYEMFAGSVRFSELHAAEPGSFYLTDFLARHFERLVIKGLGMDRRPELKAMYFGNYRKLVYLAQLEDEEVEMQARKAAEFLELDYEKVQTGDALLRSALEPAALKVAVNFKH